MVTGSPTTLADGLALRMLAIDAPSTRLMSTSATGEAKRGAALAGAGFVAFSVADEKVVSPLTSLLGGAQTAADRVLDGTAVLVFQRPRTLFVRFNGFADRDTVAQAVANAASLAS